MADRKHIIGSLCFDIQVADEAVATAFADKLRTVDCEALLSKVLSKYDKVQQTTLIDKLELDLGNIELDDMDQLSKEIMSQLEEILNKRVDISHTKFEKDRMISKGGTKLNPTELSSNMEIILHYLNNGTLPWNIIDQPDVEQLFLELLEKDIERVKKILLPELKKIIVIKRMVTIFHHSTIQLFIEKIIAQQEVREMDKLVTILEKHISFSQIIAFTKRLHAIYLTTIYKRSVVADSFYKEFVKMLLPVIELFSVSVLQVIYKDVQEKFKDAVTDGERFLYKNVPQLIEEAINKKGSLIIDTAYANPSEALLKEKKDALRGEENIIEPHIVLEFEKLDTEEQGSPPTDEETDIYFIDNAGLILLNPGFMMKSFEEFGWVVEKKIINEEARCKMMVWLDHLVWGDQKIYEYRLMLNKILVGLHPTALSDIHVSLSDLEKKAAEEMLKAITEHWSILKNTSVQNLQTTFLQRS